MSIYLLPTVTSTGSADEQTDLLPLQRNSVLGAATAGRILSQEQSPWLPTKRAAGLFKS